MLLNRNQMKRITTIFLIAALAILFAGNLSAQSFKFGYINTSDLMKDIPEIEAVQKEMEQYAKELELVLEEMQVELNKKADAYQKSEATLSEAAKKTRLDEMNTMRTKIQERANSAETDYTDRSQKLMAPVFAKVRAAISNVGKNNGFTYIFETSANPNTGATALPFINPDQATDILEMVKAELNKTR